MPESKVRRKQAFTPPAAKVRGSKQSPRWWAPVMVALMVLGLVWVIVYYVSQGRYPVPPLGAWNLVAGFSITLVGFGMTTRWR